MNKNLVIGDPTARGVDLSGKRLNTSDYSQGSSAQVKNPGKQHIFLMPSSQGLFLLDATHYSNTHSPSVL